MTRFGENLKRLRIKAGISQKGLARRLKFKDAANSNISTLERRSTDVPLPKTIRKYAEALGCEPWEFLVGVLTEYDQMQDERLQTIKTLWPVVGETTKDQVVHLLTMDAAHAVRSRAGSGQSPKAEPATRPTVPQTSPRVSGLPIKRVGHTR